MEHNLTPNTHLPPTAGGPPDAQNPSAVPVLTRVVVFINGQPQVQNVPMFTKQQVKDILVASVTELYDADPTLEPQYVGKTNMEVMLSKRVKRAALTGDDDAVEKLLDRLIDKPKTVNESKTLEIKGSYEDVLKDIARRTQDEAELVDAEVVPVKRTEVPDFDPLEGLK